MALKKRSKKQKRPRVSLKHHITGAHKPHKPILKRHVSFLTLTVVVLILLTTQLIAYMIYTYRLQDRAEQSSSEQLNIQPARQPKQISSTLGFDITVDAARFDIVASEVLSDGTLRSYDENNLSDARPFSIVQIVPTLASDDGKIDASRLTVLTTEKSGGADLSSHPDMESLKLAADQFAEQSSAAFDVVTTSETTVQINGQVFLRQQFMSIPKVSSGNGLSKVQTVVITTFANGKVYALKVSGLEETETTSKYDAVINSFRLTGSKTLSHESKLPENIHAVALKQNLFPKSPLEHILGTQDAYAQTEANGASTTSKMVARNTPAVVKIYNIACGRIIYLGQPLASGCDGGQGSGFLVSGDGYIATNGHVVSTTAKDLVANSILYGPDVLIEILRIEGYTEAEVTAIIEELRANPSLIVAVAQSVYQLTESQIHFEAGNHKLHYVIALGDEIPNFEPLFSGTTDSVEESSSVKNAKLLGTDYDFNDLLTGEFSGSDVALLKIAGDNYPYLKLGSIDEAAQGTSVTVIGFPGLAENELVSNETIEPTITNGVVSAVRDTNDGEHKVVQSDVSVSHGNSGGPAFGESGNVFGIATYSYGAQASEDHNISYMRDIKDFQILASAKGLDDFSDKSKTQDVWDDGLDLFFRARYSRAIPKFRDVKKLYPAHRLADSYIALAETRIANGEDIKDFWPAVLLIGGIVVAVGGAGTGAYLIISHRKRHHAFKSGQPTGQPPVQSPPPAAAPPPQQPPQGQHRSVHQQTPSQSMNTAASQSPLAGAEPGTTTLPPNLKK